MAAATIAPPGRLSVRILMPAREAYSGAAESINVTALEGEVGILPGHAAFLAALKPGPASVREGGITHVFALGDGFLEVHDNIVTVLVQSAERPEDIDVTRARSRKAGVEEQLKAAGLDDDTMRRLEVSLAKQNARLHVAGDK